MDSHSIACQPTQHTLRKAMLLSKYFAVIRVEREGMSICELREVESSVFAVTLFILSTVMSLSGSQHAVRQ